MNAGTGPKDRKGGAIVGVIILIILIVIVVSIDIYFAKIMKNYINKTQNVIPQIDNLGNPAQIVYMQNVPQQMNHVTYVSLYRF